MGRTNVNRAEVSVFTGELEHREHLVGKLMGRRRRFEAQLRARLLHSKRGIDHHRKDAPDFFVPAAWKQADEMRIAFLSNALGGERIEHRMSDKNRLQSALFVERFLEWKNAQHQIEKPRHFRDAPAVPSPDLGANVIDNLRIGVGRSTFLSFSRPKSLGQPQIESWIIDQDHCVRL